MDSSRIALSTWQVCQAEAVRSALCQCREEEALGSVSHRRVGKARHHWRQPSATSHRVAQTKPSFSCATNLSRSWREASLESWKANSLPWESPTCLRSHSHECLASLRILREHPAERAGGVGGAAAIPGCRGEAGERRRMLSHRQAGGADRRGPAGGFGRAAAGACPALPGRRTAPSLGRLF